jgi:predicted nucleic acid-binding protein
VLVLDASVVVPDCATGRGFDYLGDRELLAPGLMWAEARCSLHQAAWRGEIAERTALEAHGRLLQTAIRKVDPQGSDVWRIADELGWAKTYDAEYIALASSLGCRLVTLDARLRRGADRLGFVVGPGEL